MPNERQYELVYIVAPTAGDTELEAFQRELSEHIETLGGAVESTDLWGRRKLAYAIGPFTEGIYIVQLINGPAAMISELERRLRVRDQVLRYLTVRVDEDLRKARLAAEKRKAAAAASREPPGPAPSAAGETPVATVESDTPSSSDDKSAAAVPREPGSASSAAGETSVAAVENDAPSSDDKSNDTGPASETSEVQE